MMTFIWICLGGALGTGARYLMSDWIMKMCGTAFSYGTVAVNALGSFLVGMVMYAGLNTELLSPTARIVLATGVLGGFTTYSSFNYETLEFFKAGDWLPGLTYFTAMSVLCLLAGVLGLAVTRWWIGN